MIKNFLSGKCVSDLLERLSSEEWYDKDPNVPLRITTDINLYPILNEEVTCQLGKDFFIKDRIYFSKYIPETRGKSHTDPCNYTLIVLLQKSLGGNFMLDKNELVKLSPGDAVLFKGNTNHFITEVISGTRIALAVWFNAVPEQYKI